MNEEDILDLIDNLRNFQSRTKQENEQDIEKAAYYLEEYHDNYGAPN